MVFCAIKSVVAIIQQTCFRNHITVPKILILSSSGFLKSLIYMVIMDPQFLIIVALVLISLLLGAESEIWSRVDTF
jgi:hypothetical protein